MKAFILIICAIFGAGCYYAGILHGRRQPLNEWCSKQVAEAEDRQKVLDSMLVVTLRNGQITDSLKAANFIRNRQVDSLYHEISRNFEIHKSNMLKLSNP